MKGLHELYRLSPKNAIRNFIQLKTYALGIFESNVFSAIVQNQRLGEYFVQNSCLFSINVEELLLEVLMKSLAEDIAALKRIERIAEHSHLSDIPAVIISGIFILSIQILTAEFSLL